MKFKYRRDQLFYFIGFASRTKKNQLSEAMERCACLRCGAIQPNSVFEVCPFNDNLEQVIRSFHIFENGKHNDLVTNLQNILKEFFFLASDFEPNCCGDGRLFYCLTSGGVVCMECDRCNQLFNLGGEPVVASDYKLMNKYHFAKHYGEDSFADWPFHTKLLALENKNKGQ